MAGKSPLINLNNGVKMPALGLGVFAASAEETASAIASAISSGYRLIDTARSYNNEAQVGEGIRNSGVDRAEMFVTTKLFNGDYGYERALRAFDESLGRLGLDYVDLYLLHWPTKDWNATIQSWKAAEKILGDGRARAIGVCNFLEDQLDELIAASDVVPAVNQIELHPYFAQKPLLAKNRALGIVTEAWSPIGGAINDGDGDNHGGRKHPLTDPVITTIAEAHGRSAAQVILRWHFQNDVVAIPKSVNPERIAKNIDVFDFALSDAEMAQLDELDTGVRIGPDPRDVDTSSFAEFV
ncbi:MAG: aldo/keto reductase [Kiritimatiellae bacterium]|nr:aldo/keto reductase [Kiritimatiellia bacterium]